MAMDDRDLWGGYGDFRRGYERFGYGYPYDRFAFERERERGEHTWRGGILGWLGAGIRAGAGWFGSRLQQWGTLFGGRVTGRTAEIGRAVRGRGEQMASALEDQEERRNRQPRYRRPDERILDDVWIRISLAAVDSQDVEVEVTEGIVRLSGRVSTRFEKRVIEEIAESVFGVREVNNQLRLARIGAEARPATANIEPLPTNAAAPTTQRSFDSTVGQVDRH